MLRPFLKLLIIVIVLSAASLAGAYADEPIDPESVKLPKMTPTLNQGKVTYDDNCSGCHGENAAGTEIGPTFLQHVYRPGQHGNATFYGAVSRGVTAHHWEFGNMEPVEDLTVYDVKKVILYIRALQKMNGVF
jgi:mono/diheme cytochrome c family protein